MEGWNISPFKFDHLPETLVRKEWFRWKRNFELIVAASEEKNVTKLKNVLLAKGGLELQDLFHSIDGADVIEDKTKGVDPYRTAMEKLNEHFSPKQYDSFERNEFCKLSPVSVQNGTPERLSEFLMRCSEQAKRCDFGKTSAESRDLRIIDKVIYHAPTELKEKLLHEEKLTLEQLTRMVNSYESSKIQARAITGSGTGNGSFATEKKSESVSGKYKKEPNAKDKTRKRKHSKTNGTHDSSRANNYSSEDEMEYSINAILSGLEKDLNDTTDAVEPAVSVKKEPVDKDSSSAGNSSSASKKKKKKKKTDDIDTLQAELLQKIAAQYSEVEPAEQDTIKSTSVKIEPAETSNTNGEQSKKRKKKKKSKTHDEDDFEASIMSSILKCAAEADEDDINKPPPPSGSTKKLTSKTPRKSVRFDETITEASFNAFDASELLEISQLHAPALSSTLKDIDHHK